MLGQGTLRPDLIESASDTVSGNAQVIKTHHNDSQLVRVLREEGRVVEPLRDFHKDEVINEKNMYYNSSCFSSIIMYLCN